MSGRGNLLKLFNKETDPSLVSASSSEHEKDSGLEANTSGSSGERRQAAPKPTQDELVPSLKQLNIGRGRAQLLATFKGSTPIEDQQQLGSVAPKASALSSGGESGISKADEHTSEFSAKADDDSDVNKQKNDLFYPTVVQGSKGEALNLACNYIGLESDPNKGVFVYEVRFSPTIDSMHLRMKYLNEHRDKFGGTKTFDGSVLYLPILLGKELTTFVSKAVDNTDVEIRVKFKKKEALKNCIHLYNILFDRVMKTLNFVRFDRKQFDPTCPKIIPLAKLEVWPGYVTAVDEYDGGLMLCCDVSHRLLCQKTVLEMLIEIYQHNKSQYQESAKKSLLGSIVITRYNNRTYKINDICFDQNPLNTFETTTGSTSYVQYYQKHHNIVIRDTKQPLLLSLKKTRGDDAAKSEDIRFCLIPELCYLTGLRDEIRADNKLMREIATFTRVTPNQRMLALNKFYENIAKSKEAREILDNWGLSLARKGNNVNGRKMDQELIQFAKKSVLAGKNAEFSKDAVSNEPLEVVHMKNWLLVHFKNDQRVAKSLLDNMERCCAAFGMRIAKPKTISLDNDRVEAYVHALRTNIDRDSQIVVCICPTSRDDRYAAIKKICCAELPIPSQVINARTLFNETKNRSIVQKIILQMNCKLGGSLWTVKIPFKNVMICGIDSYHDPRQKSNSVAAFVASLNSSYSHWFSKAVIQTKKEEIVNGLTSSFELALNAYKEFNGHLPDSVIIYRDGVGDGQLNICSKYEIPQFEAVCANRVKITFIVVQKRINTRFFTGTAQNYENPLPGTVVDRFVTRSQMYDFFLVSQMVRQGTVSPTHFVVLRDDSNYGPDIIQKLSYKLCFLYYNWPGTVRIPACCMYAHKLAYLIGESIQRETAESLSNKLFYL